MDAKRWKKIDEIVDAALELPAEDREKFVTLCCRKDLTLKQEVLELLSAHDESNDFLQKSAMNLMAKAIADDDRTIFDNSFLNKTFGNYRIESMLGAGGMGEVYLATDDKLKRKVALKILPAEYTSNDERVKRFQLEARAISALNHPNIVTIYDVGNFDGINYIATEFVEGKTLRELINSKPKLIDTLKVIIQSCEALAAAHKAGIIHRDIKPENIMVRPDGYVKILDFGLAKLSEINLNQLTMKSFAKTAKGVIIGTPAYMSPEQVADENVDHRTDLWSIGVVLYELLTGKNPFKKENRQATFQAVLSEEPPIASSLNGEISDELDRILIKALEKDADLSYQTASDIRADLKRVKREFDSSPSWSSHSGSGRSVKTEPEKKRGLFLPLAAVSFIVLLIIGSALFYYFRFVRNNSAAPDWSAAQNIKLTDQAGTEFYPSLSADGKTYIFAAENGDQYDIYSRRVEGKNPLNLTADSKADDTQPSFSPDGERIAFRSERDQKGIYIMGASGESPRRLADFGYTPKWSPDGKEIAVSTLNQAIPAVRSASQIFIINVESGEKRLLIDNYALQPDWSPNGKQIAYWFTESGGRRDVATIPVSGGEPTVITSTGNTNWNPVWSPDGKFLYFASDRGGSMAFWRVAIDEETGKPLGEPETVLTPAKFNRHLAFSRDGKRLIYVQTDNQANIKTIGFDEKTEKFTGTSSFVTTGNREVYFPDLSPDGKFFVARQASLTQEDLIVFNSDGTNQRELTTDKFFDRYPRLSPDGKQVLFASDRSGKYEIWIINTDGTNLKQLTFVKDISASIPAWSPDGTRISFDTGENAFIMDLSKPSGEENMQKLPDPGGDSFFRACDWSSDGKKIIGFFEKGSLRGMAIYYLETKSYEKINNMRLFNFWLPDDRRIVYSNNGKIFITDTETKKETELADAPQEYVRNVNISPDGKTIYYSAFNSESDIWMLDLTANQ